MKVLKTSELQDDRVCKTRRGSKALHASVALGLTFVVLVAPGRARAESTCSYSGPFGTYYVGKLTLGSGYGLGSFGGSIADPIQYPFVDKSGWHVGMAAFVVNAATGEIPTYIVRYASASAPRGVVEVNGRTIFNDDVPATIANGSDGAADDYAAGVLQAGNYYVVAFGFGPPSGLTGRGGWSFGVNYGGLDCEKITPRAEMVDYNQTDFRGGTQIFAPGAGYASGQHLEFDVARSHVFGMTYAGTIIPAVPVAGTMNFSYISPTGSGPARRPFDRLISTGGHYSMSASYSGLDPNLDINFLAVDLPEFS